MVMELVPLFTIGLAVLFIWLLWLTFITYQTKRLIREFGKGIVKKDIISLLRQLSVSIETTKSDLSAAKQEMTTIKENSRYHFQKLGFLRFNPFEDTGGDQSFCLCLLDQNNNGIVITSLHSRDATRLYAKTVDASVGKKADFSEEEWRAYQEALKSHQKLPSALKEIAHDSK